MGPVADGADQGSGGEIGHLGDDEEQQAERKVDQEKAAKLAEKVVKGKRFDLEDFRDQLQQMKNMGGVSSMLDKLPAEMAAKAGQADMDKVFGRFEQTSAQAAQTLKAGLRAIVYLEPDKLSALEGELGELQAMWREAEEIAEIADRLPDALDEEVR